MCWLGGLVGLWVCWWVGGGLGWLAGRVGEWVDGLMAFSILRGEGGSGHLHLQSFNIY